MVVSLWPRFLAHPVPMHRTQACVLRAHVSFVNVTNTYQLLQMDRRYALGQPKCYRLLHNSPSKKNVLSLAYAKRSRVTFKFGCLLKRTMLYNRHERGLQGWPTFIGLILN